MLLFYSSIKSGFSFQMREFIANLRKESMWEHYNSIELLSRRLATQIYDINLVLIIARSRTELTNLLALRSSLLEIRVVLVLPDAMEETVRIGHKFCPRYVGYMDRDIEKLCTVISNMINNTKRWRSDRWIGCI